VDCISLVQDNVTCGLPKMHRVYGVDKNFRAFQEGLCCMGLVSSSLQDILVKLIILARYCKLKLTFTFHKRRENFGLVKRVSASQKRLELF
jgi:hypothetical protein